MYSYGARIDRDSNMLTTIDEEHGTARTRGMINGVNVEFEETDPNVIAEMQEDIAVLEARMDTFASLPDGSTAGDAELLDIRVGSDGTIYPSAGDAVRAQVGALKADINAIVPKIDFSWTLNKTISASGEESTSTYYATSDYHILNPQDRIVNTTTDRDINNKVLSVYIHYYTSAKVWISREAISYGTSHIATIPSTASYYRIVFGRASSTGVSISESDLTTYFSLEQYSNYALESDYSNTKSVVQSQAPTIVMNDKVGAMVACAMTYFDEAYKSGANLIYQSGHGLFSSDIKSDIEGYTNVNAIVCSQFATALIKGITYDNSRYELGASEDNHMSQWGFMTDGSGVYPDASYDYMWANQMYKYAVDKGFPHYAITEAHPMLRPGDLVFKKDDNEIDNFYEHIVHVGIVIGVGYQNRYVTTLESWDTTKIDGEKVGVAIRRTLITDWNFVATFPVNDSLCRAKLLYQDTDFSTPSSAATIKIIPINLPKGLYTLVLRGVVDDANVPNQNRWGYRYVGDGTTTGVKGMRNGNTDIAYIYVENSNFQDIRITRASNAAYDISSFEIYEGYINPQNGMFGMLL